MTGYSVDGLKHGIERARHNIVVLEEAIEREERTIADYRIMLADIKRAGEQKAEAEANIRIEVVTDDGGSE